jgi:hypothetical protein
VAIQGELETLANSKRAKYSTNLFIGVFNKKKERNENRNRQATRAYKSVLLKANRTSIEKNTMEKPTSSKKVRFEYILFAFIIF